MSDNSSSGAADPNAQRLATSEGSAPLRAVDLDDDSLSANQGRDSRNSSRAPAVESDTARGSRPTLEQLLVTPVQDYLASCCCCVSLLLTQSKPSKLSRDLENRE